MSLYSAQRPPVGLGLGFRGGTSITPVAFAANPRLVLSFFVVVVVVVGVASGLDWVVDVEVEVEVMVGS